MIARLIVRVRLVTPDLLIASVALTLLLAGCSDRTASSSATNVGSSPAESSDPAADAWLGEWIGPEGTFLRINGGRGKYEITVRNLDGPRSFQGSAVGDQIQFERDGVKEVIRATNGADTGMKWLREKFNCLTVRTGEGYCRD